MSRDLNKEAFLWYTMTSPEYLDRSYAKLTEAADYLRARIKEHEFIKGYPPVPRWLGAIEELEASYPNARAILAEGEHGPMGEWTGALKNIPRGFAESSMSWMLREQEKYFMDVLDKAYGVAAKYMSATTMSGLHFDDPDGDWRVYKDYGFKGASVALGWKRIAGDATEVPEYAPDTSLSCTTGELVPWTGVWIPAEGPGTASLAFCCQGQIMQPAYEVYPDEQYPDFNHARPVDVTWHPLRPTGRMLPADEEPAVNDPLRIPAGKPASQSGYWFTPAKQGSRRYFKQGDVFPEIEDSAYGATFWQWSPDQSDPSL